MAINERQKVNLASLLITLVVLLVAVEISTGSFATRINKISENLDRALSAVMAEKRPNFTDLTDNGTYVSDTSFNPKGMVGLYNFTNAFMELVLSKDFYPEGFLRIDSNSYLQLGDYQKDWQKLLRMYGGLLAMLIVLALIIVLMPLCGLCFCCCRCCGKCGARSQPFDKKHDLCKKIVLATLLICLGTMLLFGVVCAFVSNQQMQEGVDDLTGNLKNGVKDVNTYLDSTNAQINVLLDVNYGEFEEVLMTTLNESTDIVYEELANYSEATSMTELAKIVLMLPNIKTGFTTLKYSTNSLRVYASQLNDAVRKVKKDLLALLQSAECQSIPKCSDINNNVSTLQTNIHFNNLPDITDQIDTLDNLLGNDTLQESVKNGINQLDTIKEEIGKKVGETLVTARQKINEAGDAIKQGSNNITNVIKDLKTQIDDNTKPALDTAEKFINQYGPYRYYVGLTISCILLLITLCIALGLICGICGKRPDGYGDDCCNKGAGSQFLICGVMLMFIAGFLLAAIVLITFALGVVTQRVACDPLRDPKNSQVFHLIDQANFSKFYIDFKLSDALDDCYNNKTIYNVFNLKTKFNLDEVIHYLDTFEINKTLSNLDISSVDMSVELLSSNDKEIIKSFADSSFANIQDFHEFKELLDTKFTNVNLSALSSELGDLITQIEEQPGPVTDIADRLKVSKLNIEMYQEKIVEPMIKNASNVIDLAIQLENDLKLNHGSFKVAITKMLEEIEFAEEFLRTKGKDTLISTVTNFTNGIMKQIQTYLDRIDDKTRNEVGQCGPLSLVLNATLTATCDKIILPWNGFWFGLFWSVLLFIPTIIISVKLATLYQKHGPYSRGLVEAEYLYDAYVDRDNIPLNSRGGKSKKKNKKHKRYEDRPIPSAGGDMVAREYAAPSNHQDTRYADMAPKQWEDFPAGGPPQYQRAPTEYERPPPYYYPGAGENTQ